MGFKLFGVEVTDQSIPLIMETGGSNRIFWRRVVQMSPQDLQAPDIAQILQYAGDYDQPEDPETMDHCQVGDGINRTVARYLIGLVPELKLIVEQFRADMAEVLRKKTLVNTNGADAGEATLIPEHDEIKIISARLNYIDRRVGEIDKEIQEMDAVMEDAAKAQLLNDLVHGGPMGKEDLELTNKLLTNALFRGEVVAIGEQHIAQIRAALERLDWHEGGAENLPDEGLTVFAAAKRKRDGQSYIISALKTEKGMKQYLAFVRWERGKNHWDSAGRRKRELQLEKASLMVEKGQYYG